MDSKIDHGLSTEDFQTFLEAGRWSATADDNLSEEGAGRGCKKDCPGLQC